MTQQASITVFDGATPPVAHVLQPIDNKTLPDGTRFVLYREQLPSLPTEAQVRIEIRSRVQKSGVVETRTRTVVPVMESVAGQNAAGYTAAPKVAYEESKEEVSFAHPRSTGATRQLCHQMSRNFGNNVATTVAPVTAGVVYEANILQGLPT